MYDKNTFLSFQKNCKKQKTNFYMKKKVIILAKGFFGEMAIASGFLAIRNPYPNLDVFLRGERTIHHIRYLNTFFENFCIRWYCIIDYIFHNIGRQFFVFIPFLKQMIKIE